MNAITYQWIEPCPNERLRRAQELLKESVAALGLENCLYPAGPAHVKFRDVLQFARERSPGRSFVWCNSDVRLTTDPYELDDGEMVRGFHRREVPSGELCTGVDMYLIPKTVWDAVLLKDAPDLWLGASHIDWWLTRAASLLGKYSSHAGYIDHETHPESAASKSRKNPLMRHNVREYNRWARRCGAATDDSRIFLPFVGESSSPITDILRKAFGRKKASAPTESGGRQA